MTGQSSTSDHRGFIIMNAQSTLEMANAAACDALGYGRNELKGKNVAAILPPQIVEMHPSFIHNYITTGAPLLLLCLGQPQARLKSSSAARPLLAPRVAWSKRSVAGCSRRRASGRSPGLRAHGLMRMQARRPS